MHCWPDTGRDLLRYSVRIIVHHRSKTLVNKGRLVLTRSVGTPLRYLYSVDWYCSLFQAGFTYPVQLYFTLTKWCMRRCPVPLSFIPWWLQINSFGSYPLSFSLNFRCLPQVFTPTQSYQSFSDMSFIVILKNRYSPL